MTPNAYHLPMTLDDATSIAQYDRSNMLLEMEKTPSRLKPPADAGRTFPNPFREPRNIVIGGVGGSGIAGDIVTDYLRTRSEIPISVCRAYDIPSDVNEDTLFLAISYSGETRETLDLLDLAGKRGAMVATISSGGTLLATSIAKRIPFLKVASGVPPRVALPELLAAVLFSLGKEILKEEPRTILDSASKALTSQIQSLKFDAPTNRNQAKQMAEQMQNRLPLLLGPEERTSVLRRFKNELNENSKIPAIYMTIPECYHNDIEGFDSLRKLSSIQPVILKTEKQVKTIENLYSLLKELGTPPMTFQGEGEDVFSELLTAVTFGDFVSVYLAILRQTDPTALRLIPKFKAVGG